MVIDIHTHLFPDRIAEKTIRILEQTCGEKAFHNGTTEGLKQAMREADVSAACAMPVVTKPDQFDSVQRFAVQITEATADDPQRILSFGGVHPDSPDYRKELKMIKESGLPGVKLHPAYQRTYISDSRYLRILDYAGELGLTVLIHAGYDPLVPGVSFCAPKEAVRAIREVGGKHLIFAHMGGLDQWEEAREYLIGEDVLLDTSLGFAGMPEEEMREMIREHGTDRILFGTDSPWGDMKASIDKIRRLGLTEEDEQAILWKNAAKQLGVLQDILQNN